MYIGIDHSTTGVKTCLLGESGSHEQFVIDRSPDENGEWSYIERLREYVTLADIEQVAYGYSLGDRFSTIKGIDAVEGRGIVDTFGLGHEFGTGTLVFDELQASSLPTVVFPGIHDGLDSLHPYFSYHSPMTGADKLAMTRYAQAVTETDDFIAACVSASEMATFVQESVLRGAFTWMGLIHGWPGFEELRAVRDGKLEVRDLVMQSGFLYRADETFGSVEGVPDAVFLELAYYATLHHVYSLVPFTETVDRIVISGRLSRVTDPVDMQSQLADALSSVAPLHFCREYSTALGAAYIARDVAQGASEVLGVPVAESAMEASSVAER